LNLIIQNKTKEEALLLLLFWVKNRVVAAKAKSFRRHLAE